MRRLIGWMRPRSTGQLELPTRNRIDLGDEPANYPIYAIGDVHGCLNELIAAETRIAQDISHTGRAGLVVLLGDYVDRGPSSSLVLEHLINPSQLGLRRLAICGNHDDVFAKFLTAPELYMDWLALGGEQTLLSYGIDIQHLKLAEKGRHKELKRLLGEAVPANHLAFLVSLPISLKIGNTLFVHAGVRPGTPLADQSDEDLMWIREPFIAEGPKQGILVVHGHTAYAKPSVGFNRIGIDTGAYLTGKLTVLKIDGDEKFFM